MPIFAYQADHLAQPEDVDVIRDADGAAVALKNKKTGTVYHLSFQDLASLARKTAPTEKPVVAAAAGVSGPSWVDNVPGGWLTIGAGGALVLAILLRRRS